MTATMDAPVIAPGLHPDMPADVYHRHPALSSSGARRLLPPSCPALFDYERRNGQPAKRCYDFGTVAHKLILGVGDQVVMVDADNYRTKAAQQTRDGAYAAGKVPILRDEYAQAEEMATAVREHPIAGPLLASGTGRPEVSYIWQDGPIQRRARFDWLRHPDAPGRVAVVDYKTAASADPEKFERAAFDHGYHQQAPWYLDGIRALGGYDDPQFVFVVQEKRPPYLVSVVQLDYEALAIGAVLNRQAIRLFADCQASGRWPGYADGDIPALSLPTWFARRYDKESL